MLHDLLDGFARECIGAVPLREPVPEPGDGTEPEQDVLDRFLVGRIVKPILDRLLTEQLVDIDTEVCPEVPGPIDGRQVELRQASRQLSSLLTHRRQEQCDGCEHQRREDDESQDRPEPPWNPQSLEGIHRGLQDENEPGGKSYRQPNHPDCVGDYQKRIPQGQSPNSDPDDQRNASEPFTGHVRSLTLFQDEG